MSTTSPHPTEPPKPLPADASVGELLSHITADLSQLMRQEVALAKAEIRVEVAKAGKGAGLLGAAGYASHMLLLFGSVALALGLSSFTGKAWAFLIVCGAWAVLAVALALLGKRVLSTVQPKPERTIQTLKEDAQWARHPRS